MVTPLLDDRPLDAVRLLLDRGFAPLVVDVLTSEPSLPVPAWPRRRRRAPDDLALRTWRMQREALTGELASLGVPVVPWDGEGDLTGALLHVMRSADAGGPHVRRPPGPDRPGTREVMAALGWRAAAVVAVAATVAVAALPDPRRPVLTAAATTVLVALAAVITRSRLLGTLTLASTAATVLLAAALDASTTRPAQVVAAGVLLLAAMGALEHAEAGYRRRHRPAGHARPAARAGRAGGRGILSGRRHSGPGRRTLGRTGPRWAGYRGRCPAGHHPGAP